MDPTAWLANVRLLGDVVAPGVFEFIVSVSVAVPVPLLLVALKLTAEVPAAVGVPETSPVVVLTVKPAGNPDAP